MSLLVNGEPRPNWFETESEDGEFVREDAQFRNWITPDGAPGPSGEGGLAAEAGRYHLYVSYACPPRLDQPGRHRAARTRDRPFRAARARPLTEVRHARGAQGQ